MGVEHDERELHRRVRLEDRHVPDGADESFERHPSIRICVGVRERRRGDCIPIVFSAFKWGFSFLPGHQHEWQLQREYS